MDNYNEKEEEKTIDNSLYTDGEDKKPKMVIIIASIVAILLVILVCVFAFSKLNKKSTNNYLTSISVTNGELEPEYNKEVLNYTVSASEDIVTIKCSSESSKATTNGCDKRIYLQDECVEHVITVTAQSKDVRKYTLNICKQSKDAPVIKDVKVTPTGYTNSQVKVEVVVESVNPLNQTAYSFDGGENYQESNTYIVTDNTTLQIRVRDEKNNESAIFTKEITNIDSTKPAVIIEGSVESGVSTTSNVTLTAIVTPDTTVSGYKYQWYRGSTKINGATKSTYSATTTGDYKVVVTTGSGNSVTFGLYKVNIKKSSSGSSTNDSKVVPVIKSVTGNPTSWTNKNVTLKVNATAVNGLHDTAYSFDGGKTYQKSNSKEFSSNQKGTIVVRDKKGNKTAYSFNIFKIDKTVPKASIEGNTTLGSTLKAVVSPSTTPSGYKYQWYKSDTAISGATKNTYTPTSTGTYKVKVTTGAGNTVVSKTVSIVPAVKPTITLTGSVGSGTWTNKSVTLTAKVNNGTATKYVWYRGTSQISSGTSNTYSASVSGTYKVVATTSSGEITSSSYKVNIDTVTPKVTILATLGGYDGSSYTGNSWTNKSVYITVSAYDESGIASITSEKSLEKNINGQTATARTHYDSDGSYTFTVTVTDKAGNKITRTQNVKIDKTAPYTSVLSPSQTATLDVDCYEEKGTSTVSSTKYTKKNFLCMGTTTSYDIKTLDRDNVGGSGIKSCQIIWYPANAASSCKSLGSFNDFNWNLDNNTVTGYNTAKWVSDTSNKCATNAVYLSYARKCCDNAGNCGDNSLFVILSQK